MKSTPTPKPGRVPANRPAAAATAQRAANAQRTQDFVRGVIAEMKRVTWPSRDEWVGATLLTIALVVGVGLFTSGADWIFGRLFSLLTNGAR
jgi:preprotein translocase SecE subunit